MKESNKIITVQEMLMREMQRLDDNDYMKTNANDEIKRSNALSNQAQAYIKAVNTTLRVIDTSIKQEKNRVDLLNTLGLIDND